jgi:hypothetical protein
MDWTTSIRIGRNPRRLVWCVLLANLLCGSAPCRAADRTVLIFGQITDKTTGAPLPNAYVSIQQPQGPTLSSTASDSSGSYSFVVPWQPSYTVAASVWVDNASYRVLRYMPAMEDVSIGDVSELRHDINLRPAANLVLQVYTAQGTLVRRAAFVSLTANYASATDLNDIPVYGGVSVSGAQEYSTETGWDWDLAMPAFAVPPGTPTRLHALWEIPSFGKVMVDFDNQGSGYSVQTAGDYIVLNLNREAAASEVARLKRESDQMAKAGYELSAEVATDLSSAQNALQQGEGFLDASSPDIPKAVDAFNNALAMALSGQETLYLDKAVSDIPRFRKGKLRLQVRTPRGQPLAGATVTYRQQSHDFQFGGSYLTDGWSYVPQIGDTLAAAGFNASSVMLSYKILEPQPGQYDWSYIDRYSGLEIMIGKGFRLQGELAYWANGDPSFGDVMCPDYWRTMTFDEMNRNVHDHFRALASRYGSRLGPWEFNEQNVMNCLSLTWEQKRKTFSAVMDGLHAGDSGAQNVVNAVAMPYGWSQDAPGDPSAAATGIAFPAYLDMLLQNNLPVDSIGLEFYHFGVSSVAPYGGPPGLSLAAMARLLDLYSGYQKPVYVKEFQVPSTQENGSCWWHRPWDPATQAEFSRKFYTLAFSRPNVQGVQWSAFVSDRNTFIKNAGLLDSAYQPKPVYDQLKDLIQSWTTSGSTTTNAQGEADIVGFAGDYVLQVGVLGHVAPDIRTHVYEQRDIARTITYEGLPAVRGRSRLRPSE